MPDRLQGQVAARLPRHLEQDFFQRKAHNAAASQAVPLFLGPYPLKFRKDILGQCFCQFKVMMIPPRKKPLTQFPVQKFAAENDIVNFQGLSAGWGQAVEIDRS